VLGPRSSKSGNGMSSSCRSVMEQKYSLSKLHLSELSNALASFWFGLTSEIRKETRIRDRLRKKYIKNRIGTNERKYKNQRNKVNNLKKFAKENFYVSINEKRYHYDIHN
jgi:hypothetical protein